MKKLSVVLAAALLCGILTGCEKPVFDEGEEPVVGGEVMNPDKCKNFKFTLKGDFGGWDGGVTRGYMSADGKDMTDLWVFDFMGGECVQSLHQESSTAGDAWGCPSLALAYGSHHVYFAASRGASPVVDNDAHTITWSTVSDTFWKDYEVSVVSTSNGNRAVTLDRVVTKLKVTATDEVPVGCASVTITPAVWYYGLNYMTGAAINPANTARTVSVPASYIGTTGELSVSIYGMSGASEWTTDFTVTAKDVNNAVIGSATVTGAPFKRNRATEYSGCLFGSGGQTDVSLNSAWDTPTTGTW